MTVRFCTSILRSICTGLGVVVHGAECHRLGTRVRTCPVRQMQNHERDSRPPAGGRLLAERVGRQISFGAAGTVDARRQCEVLRHRCSVDFALGRNDKPLLSKSKAERHRPNHPVGKSYGALRHERMRLPVVSTTVASRLLEIAIDGGQPADDPVDRFATGAFRTACAHLALPLCDDALSECKGMAS